MRLLSPYTTHSKIDHGSKTSAPAPEAAHVHPPCQLDFTLGSFGSLRVNLRGEQTPACVACSGGGTHHDGCILHQSGDLQAMLQHVDGVHATQEVVPQGLHKKDWNGRCVYIRVHCIHRLCMFVVYPPFTRGATRAPKACPHKKTCRLHRVKPLPQSSGSVMRKHMASNCRFEGREGC